MNSAVVFLDWAAKVTVVVALALGVVALLRRQSAAARHWVLAIALTCAAALPLLHVVVPAWPLPGWNPGTRGWGSGPGTETWARGRVVTTADEGAANGQAPTGGPATPAAGAGLDDGAVSPLTIAQALSLTWLAGLFLGLCALLTGLVRLMRLSAHSRAVTRGRCLDLLREMSGDLGLRRRVQLLETDHPAWLLTWGLFRPKILLPRAARDWPDDLYRIVFSHELAHISRNDWVVQLLAELLRYVYWFNPLVWIAAARLRQESEHACDDAVLRSGVEGSDYAAHLLHLARAARSSSLTWLPAPAMARPSSLERRIAAMLDDDISRRSMPPAVRVTAAGSLLALTVLLAGVAVFAQSFATLSGSVIDPTNRVLINTTLLLTNAQTQAKYEVRSDSTGRFEFVGLPAGRYNLEAALPGFATFKIELTITGQRLQKDIALQVSSLQETITVRALTGTLPTSNQPSPGAAPPLPPPPPLPPRPAIPSRSAENCTPTAAGGNIIPPRKLVDVKPVYPEDLAQATVGGLVILDARIQPDGNVGEVTVTSPAHPALDAAAIDAVRQWQFSSTLLNCEPIEVKMKVNVTFRGQ